MIRIENDISLSSSQSYLIKKLSMALSMDISVFDIETTGFSRKYSTISVIGTLRYSRDTGNCSTVQFFCPSPESEPEAISAFRETLAADSLLISFNGISFDVPYLKAKCESLGIDPSFLDMAHIDLYKIAKSVFAGEKSLKLKDIERKLNISRKDTISGLQAADNYKEYLRTGDDSLRDSILLHNIEDVVNLIDLFPISFMSHSIFMPVKVSTESTTFIITSVDISGDLLLIKVNFLRPPHVSFLKDAGFSRIDYIYDGSKMALHMKVPLLIKGGILVMDSNSLFNSEFCDLPAALQKSSIVKQVSGGASTIFYRNVIDFVKLMADGFSK